ncbi:MAG: hypothetical protein R3B70_33225 [Polyangiaceae bacterium]
MAGNVWEWTADVLRPYSDTGAGSGKEAGDAGGAGEGTG